MKFIIFSIFVALLATFDGSYAVFNEDTANYDAVDSVRITTAAENYVNPDEKVYTLQSYGPQLATQNSCGVSQGMPNSYTGFSQSNKYCNKKENKKLIPFFVRFFSIDPMAYLRINIKSCGLTQGKYS